MELDLPNTSSHSHLSHNVPWEILTSIIEQVDDLHTLCQLCLVSSAVLEPAGRALWRNVELKTARTVLLFFHSPTLISSTNRLRPLLGLPLLLNLSINLPRTEYQLPANYPSTILVSQSSPNITVPTISPTPDRLLSASAAPLALNTLSFSASNRDAAIDQYLRLYLPHLNPRRLVLTTTPANQIIFFIPNVRQSRGLKTDFGRWNRLEEVVCDGVALMEFPPKMLGAGGATTLLPCVEGLFTSEENGAVVPKMVFNLRRGRREGFKAWAGVNVARSWGKFVSWLEESGVRDTEGIQEGGVEIMVSEEEDEGIVREAIKRLVRKEGRYRVVLRK